MKHNANSKHAENLMEIPVTNSEYGAFFKQT